MMNNSVILLSGGLDSLVALGYLKKNPDYDIKLALTFNYGQKSLLAEVDASRKIAQYYNISHEVIELEWLKNITKTSLVSADEVPTSSFGTFESSKSVWVPNRNSLFLNIAACFCDSYGYNTIVYGANKDEAGNFPDNTESFRAQISECFKTSTLVKPRVIAPLINYSKSDIVRIAVEGFMPLELVRSCYNSSDKHCGKCESCDHLKRALLANNCERYISLLFEDYEI